MRVAVWYDDEGAELARGPEAVCATCGAWSELTRFAGGFLCRVHLPIEKARGAHGVEAAEDLSVLLTKMLGAGV